MHALALSDPQWAALHGGYRQAYDVSVALRSLALGASPTKIWKELWKELHHQGNVGEASYASVSWLVEICMERKIVDNNLFQLINLIEVCRKQPHNPPLPGWMSVSYHVAWAKLFGAGLHILRISDNKSLTRPILATIALYKGQDKLGRLLTEFDESEIEDIYEQFYEEEPRDS